MNQKILMKFLEKVGIEGDIAENGRVGVETYIYKNPYYYDVVLMDIQMPEMDGKTAGKEIRKYEREHRINEVLLVFISGNCTESEMMECLNPEGEIRANHFFRKPIGLKEFRQLYTNAIYTNFISLLKDMISV